MVSITCSACAKVRMQANNESSPRGYYYIYTPLRAGRGVCEGRRP